MEEKTAEGETSQSGCFFCTMLPLIERRWSEATRGHFKNSRIEFLKGMRSLIDDRIAQLSKAEPPGTGTRVTVE
jgi:hypothetical protein